jgi:hypothetical protein
MTLVYTSKSGPSGVVVELTSNGQCRGATIQELTSDDVGNESNLPGTTLTDALDAVQIPATGTEPGYLSRHVYVHPASPHLGTTFAGVTIEAATTWTTPADVPPGNFFDIQESGSGGGGGGGNRPAGDGRSGPGGGGGARLVQRLSRAEVVALLPIAIVGALGGIAGVGGVNVNLVVTVVCTPGGNGGTSSFGPFTAGGGSGGQAGSLAHGGSGGGFADAPTPTNVATALPGGPPSNTIGVSGLYIDGAGTTANTTSNPGLPSVYGGASGGTVPGTSEASADGGRSVNGGGGGGSGRGCDTSTGAGATGGAGGGRWTGASTTGGGGAGGPGTAAAGPPAPATPGAPGDATSNGDGGGGGGSNDGNTSPSMTAGDGAAGGFPGGGGGGGGSTRLVTLASRTFAGGQGGPGADGMVMVTAYA